VAREKGRAAVLGALAILSMACTTPGVGQGGMAGEGVASRGAVAPVRPGISVLMTDSIGIIRGLRVGLLTNQTGIDEHGVSDIDLLAGPAAKAAGVRLVALYSPEHGIRGTEDRENLASGRDERTGLVVNSLYTNGTIGPPDSTLRGVDVLVVDLQDIGTRTWTYVGAVVYSMRSAARNHIPIVVLDRPNPVSGRMNGPLLDPALANAEEPRPGRPGRAYALYPVPLRHGLTMGEMARVINADLRLGADLRVVPMQGYRRDLWFDETGLPWVRPSPNLPTLTSSTVYPSLVPFEASNLSVGRGTPESFQQLGAPWLQADTVVALLNARGLPGVRFDRVTFTPVKPPDGKFGGRAVPGVRVVLTDRNAFHAGRTGAALLWAIARTSPDSLEVRAGVWDERFGRPPMREALLRGEDPDAVVARDEPAVAAWVRQVAPYLLYR
jgi:uncharacterized protein YbbC (DUF1343 family)